MFILLNLQYACIVQFFNEKESLNIMTPKKFLKNRNPELRELQNLSVKYLVMSDLNLVERHITWEKRHMSKSIALNIILLLASKKNNLPFFLLHLDFFLLCSFN